MPHESIKDNSYMDILYTGENPDTAFSPAQLRVNKTDPWIQTPHAHYLSVEKFNIPVYSVPLFTFRENTYTTSLEFNGTEISKDIIYKPSNSLDSSTQGSVYQYVSFIGMINQTWQSIWTDLKLAEPGLPSLYPPHLYYDPQNQLLSLYAEEVYLTTPINIYLNQQLSKKLGSFGQFEITSDKFQLLVKDSFTNSVVFRGEPSYVMTNSYVFIQTWSDFERVLVLTDTIPVVLEGEGSQQDKKRAILTDFIPFQDVDRVTSLQYFNKGNSRLANMISNYPLRSVDLRVVAENSFGELSPIYINRGTTGSVKLGIFDEDYVNLNQTINQ